MFSSSLLINRILPIPQPWWPEILRIVFDPRSPAAVRESGVGGGAQAGAHRSTWRRARPRPITASPPPHQHGPCPISPCWPSWPWARRTQKGCYCLPFRGTVSTVPVWPSLPSRALTLGRRSHVWSLLPRLVPPTSPAPSPRLSALLTPRAPLHTLFLRWAANFPTSGACTLGLRSSVLSHHAQLLVHRAQVK